MKQPYRFTMLLSAALCAGMLACAKTDKKEKETAMSDNRDTVIRKALGAGRWFPGTKDELAKTIDGFVDKAKVEKTEGKIVSAIAPHAGYEYSGPVAGYTFRAIKEAKDKPQTVAILGLSHHISFSGVALMDGDAISTPLGETPIDKTANRLLAAASDSITEDYRPHHGEHSAENEIPFIQQVLPDAKLVVAIMGDHNMKTVDEMVSALTKLAEKTNLLVIASTDLLHNPDYNKVTTADKRTLENITSMDFDGLVDSWSGTNQVCCGIMPVVTAMKFARAMGAKKGNLLYYRNSGDDFPESRGNWVVGYGAVTFTVED